MSNRSFILSILIGAIILAGGYVLWNSLFRVERADSTLLPEPMAEAEKPIPTFAWRFEEADTNNPDGGAQTTIYLSASYNGTSTEKLIDTVDGGCFELEGEKHEGDISNTGKVQCYYAGLGQSYRIVKTEAAYMIEKKFWEEALPDTEPEPEQWEHMVAFYF